jgi:hypothetical protein
MSKKTSLLLALFAMLWFVLGGLCGFFAAKGIYDQPLEESVTRDTTTTIDTIPDIAPTPKDSTHVKWLVRYLPAAPAETKHDTITDVRYIELDHFRDSTQMVAVEVPITSKHYQSPEYDAWVSGYEASLDSIKVYQKEAVITERVVVSKPPNRLSLDVEAGADYMTQAKDMATFAFGDLTYRIKDSRFAIGLRGGIVKMPTDKSQMFVGGVVKLKIF